MVVRSGVRLVRASATRSPLRRRVADRVVEQVRHHLVPGASGSPVGVSRSPRSTQTPSDTPASFPELTLRAPPARAGSRTPRLTGRLSNGCSPASSRERSSSWARAAPSRGASRASTMRSVCGVGRLDAVDEVWSSACSAPSGVRRACETFATRSRRRRSVSAELGRHRGERAGQLADLVARDRATGGHDRRAPWPRSRRPCRAAATSSPCERCASARGARAPRPRRARRQAQPRGAPSVATAGHRDRRHDDDAELELHRTGAVARGWRPERVADAVDRAQTSARACGAGRATYKSTVRAAGAVAQPHTSSSSCSRGEDDARPQRGEHARARSNSVGVR